SARQLTSVTSCPYTTLFRSASRSDQVSKPRGFHSSTREPPMHLYIRGMCFGAAIAMAGICFGQISNFQISSTEVNPGESVTLTRSEEHTSELQSREKLVCRL